MEVERVEIRWFKSSRLLDRTIVKLKEQVLLGFRNLLFSWPLPQPLFWFWLFCRLSIQFWISEILTTDLPLPR